MSGKKKVSSRKSTGRKSVAAKKESNPFVREAVLWVILAISVLLFLSNMGLCGVVGAALSKVMFGLFGLLAYIFPVFLVYLPGRKDFA